MSQDALEVVPVPRDVHDDFLMSYLLLRAVVSLCERDTGNPPPANLGMLAWNDLLAWAQLKFSEGTQQVLMEYATALDRCFTTSSSAALPYPSWEDPTTSKPAERLAQHLLDSGAGTLWHSSRQVVRLLKLELPRHSFAALWKKEQSWTAGVYGCRQFTGLCKETLTHPNAVRLLNGLVMRICPWHKWTTIAIMYNYETPLHRDNHNGPDPSLVFSLSLHEQGEIWIEDSLGTHMVESDAGWLRGASFSLQLQAIRFLAHRRHHFTCAWSEMDRVVLSAYTVNRWECISSTVQERLESLGFVLPCRRNPSRCSTAQDSLLPAVLRNGS